MWIFIQPNDTLFFRDGRPFEAGADVWTGTVFPPYPPTIHGMLRTLLVHLLSNSINYADFFSGLPEEWKGLLGDTSRPGTLSIRGPFPARKHGPKASLWITPPADLLMKTDPGEEPRYHLLQPHDGKLLKDYSDLDEPLFMLGFHESVDGSTLDPPKGALGRTGLERYLLGKTDAHGEIGDVVGEQFWQEEPGTIIKRDGESHTVEPHQLAHPLHTRMQCDLPFEETGFLVKMDDPVSNITTRLDSLFKDPCVQKLGGEGRVSFIGEVEPDVFPDELLSGLEERVSQTGRFRIVLTSPAIFHENGFYPDFLERAPDGRLQGDWCAGEWTRSVRLVAAAMQGRPVRIGGWDLARGVPKEMRKAVPAGSVFFFETPGFNPGADKDWAKALVASCLPGRVPGCDERFTKQGFNTILIGGWDYVSK